MEPFACEGSRRRNPQETAAYALEQHGVTLVEGFGEVVECRNGIENPGRIASFMEFGRGAAWYVSQESDGASLTWRTEPVPERPAKEVVFVFAMALGNGSPLPQPSGQFDLQVNGRRELAFRVTKYFDHWRGDSAHLVFHPRRVEAAPPGHLLYLDDVIRQESFAAFGLGFLRVPSAALPPGQPVTISVVPSNPAPSTRFFKLDGAKCISRTNLYQGLAAVCGGRTRPKLGDTYVYFGDIHTHSGWPNGGCGMGSLDENYVYARDVANLDVYALTDHDLHMLSEESPWQARIGKANEYNQPGEFVALNAYEWTSSMYGHRNVYYRGDTGPMFPCRTEGDYWSLTAPTPEQLWAHLDEAGVEAITIPHHPPATSHPLTWDYFSPKYDRLVEVYSCWGNHETALNPLRGYGSDRFEHLSIRDALAKGYQFGLIASSDGHDGHPGNAQSPDVKHHHLYHPHGSGRIGILAPELTREAVFDAMYARRCFATTGPHVAMNVTLNGHAMGSVVRTGELTQAPVLSATIAAPWLIERVQVVKSGAVVADFGSTRHAMEAEFAWPDSAYDAQQTSYYYVRLTLADGEMAWSSPIWVTPGEVV